ncbi:winged helix-turn-helix domain-containing protein [Luteimonas sp. SX5]|uniref:Winged helix-turn-helix domain-containing protein n=1 Tax=Luteimonas galliterrae TaxID=2940486 RepID=A0ABT0MLX3_9GAMM|nr:transcriptional regulator [Luteimonas galliterrae]MCL1635663.1 winged helix-turn-helix domain-containing protein [Luteimonas galliterrae]
MNIVAYRFGEYSLDLGKRELMRGDEIVALPARVFECLTCLIEHRDRAVHRDELVRAVFGRADVSDAQLGQIVLRARRTIGDDGHEQRYIRTVPRYGFSWVAPVVVETAPEGGAESEYASVSVAPIAPASVEAQPPASSDAPSSLPPRAKGRLPILIAAVVVACIGIGMLAGVLLRSAPPTSAQATVAEDAFMVLPMQVTGPGDIAWARLGLMDFVADRMRRAGIRVLSSEATLGAIAQRSASAQQGRGRVSGRIAHRQGLWHVDLEVVDRDRPVQRAQARHARLIDAARLATDRLLAAFGRSLPYDKNDAPALAERLLRAQSAMLANELDTARRILNEAPELQRNLPQLRYRLGQVDFRAGDYKRSLATVDALLAQPQTAQDPLFHARLLNARGASLVRLGRFADAELSFDQSVQLLQATPYAAELGQALTGRAVTHSAQGRFDRALADLGQARIYQVRAGDLLAVARVDANLGSVEMDRGRPAAAIGYYRAAVPVFESMGAVNELAGARWLLTSAQLGLLENDAALEESERLYALLGRIRDPAVRARTILGRAEALMAVGRIREARELLLLPAAAVPILAETHQREYLMADLARRGGDARSAAVLAERALRDWSPEQSPTLREWTQLRWLQAAAEADLPRPQFAPPPSADSLPGLLIRAIGHAARDEKPDAQREFAAALALAERGGTPADIAEAVSAQAQWLLSQGRYGEAGALIGRVAPWATRDFELAMLQLRLFRAEGQIEPWRAALTQARRLAGERTIPAELTLEPSAQPRNASATN